MESISRIEKMRAARFPKALVQLPRYLTGLYRLGCVDFTVEDPVQERFTVKVSSGPFAGTFYIRKKGRYLFISDMGQTAKEISPDFLGVLADETTEGSLLTEDILREILVMKRIRMTHAGAFQAVVPVPGEWEYNDLLGACLSFDEGISVLKRMAGEFDEAQSRPK